MPFENSGWKRTAIYYVVIIQANSSASNVATVTKCLFSPLTCKAEERSVCHQGNYGRCCLLLLGSANITSWNSPANALCAAFPLCPKLRAPRSCCSDEKQNHTRCLVYPMKLLLLIGQCCLGLCGSARPAPSHSLLQGDMPLAHQTRN